MSNESDTCRKFVLPNPPPAVWNSGACADRVKNQPAARVTIQQLFSRRCRAGILPAGSRGFQPRLSPRRAGQSPPLLCFFIPNAREILNAPSFAPHAPTSVRGTVTETQDILAENPLSSSFEERAGVRSRKHYFDRAQSEIVTELALADNPLSSSIEERVGVRSRKHSFAGGQSMKTIEQRKRPLAFPSLPDVPKVSPISQHGNVAQIIGKFGGPHQLRNAVNQLQSLLYAA